MTLRVLIAMALLLVAAAEAQAELVGHWALDDGSGTMTADSAGANHGTLTNLDTGSCWIEGRFGGAIALTLLAWLCCWCQSFPALVFLVHTRDASRQTRDSNSRK